jgi:hypothetical protein
MHMMCLAESLYKHFTLNGLLQSDVCCAWASGGEAPAMAIRRPSPVIGGWGRLARPEDEYAIPLDMVVYLISAAWYDRSYMV